MARRQPLAQYTFLFLLHKTAKQSPDDLGKTATFLYAQICETRYFVREAHLPTCTTTAKSENVESTSAESSEVLSILSSAGYTTRWESFFSRCTFSKYLNRFRWRASIEGVFLTFMHLCASCRLQHASQKNLSSLLSVSISLRADW